MLTCTDARRLLSQARDQKLPTRQRWGLKVHLAMCRFCRNFGKQLDVLSEIAHEVGEEHEHGHEYDHDHEHGDTDNAHLSPQARQRIQKRLQSQAQGVTERPSDPDDP